MKIIVIFNKKAMKLLIVSLLVAVSILHYTGITDDVISVFSGRRELPIYSVETGEKKIAITFDAAWGAEYTDEILSILRQRNVKATFFLVGFWVDRYPEKVKKIAAEGHEIGNHSTSHPHMSKLSRQQIITEIQKTQEKIERLAGNRAVKLFRPPFGDYNDRLIVTCRELGFYPIQWDVDSLDWKDLSPEKIYKRVVRKVRNGSIVLFHNNAKHTPQALPKILDDLLDKGYKIVPVSELIYKEGYYIDHTGRQKKND